MAKRTLVVLRTLGALLTLLWVAGAARAGGPPPQLEATISSDQIGLDETVQLTVTLSRDATQVYQGYLRPEPKDFDVLSTSQSESTQWTIVRGQQQTRTIEQHVYVMRPKHKGACAVPPATARIDGREIRTREFVVKVGAPSKKPAGAQPAPTVIQTPFGQIITSGGFGVPPMPGMPGAPGFEPDGMRGDEDVFVEAKADKTQAVVGEQVIVTWTLYTRGDVLHYRLTRDPHHDDFWTEELMPPPARLSWERKTVRGQEYQAATLLKRAIFPLKAGKLAVTPLEMEVTTSQTAFYANGSTTRASKPLTIEAQPLPAAGRPDGFESTNVGRFEVMGGADKVQLKAGEALTYRLLVKGAGNLRNLKVPRFEQLDGFKVYEPTVTDAVQKTDGGVEGMKVLSYLMLPRRGGELRIPPVTLHYFDPQARKYAEASLAEIKITVDGDPAKIGTAPAESKENLLKQKIRLLRIKPSVDSHFGEKLLKGPLMPLALGLPPLVLLSIMGASVARARLSRETAGSRRRRARAAAEKHLRACEGHLKAQRPSHFFGECARAIYEHLEYRIGAKCESYTMDELRRVLVERGFDEELSKRVAEELESCDFARFAASASGPGEMRTALRRVRELLVAIERARVSGQAEVAA